MGWQGWFKGPAARGGMPKVITTALLLVFALSLWYHSRLSNVTVQKLEKADEKLHLDPGVIFLETTNSLQPSPLVTCSIESAARIYEGKPIHFLMKGYKSNMNVADKSKYPALNILSSIENVKIARLVPEAVFECTPLLQWYKNVTPGEEKYWIHIQSDAYRIALLWKFGGIYFDTDVISIKPLPKGNGMGVEPPGIINAAVSQFHDHHYFIWACMRDFVENYNGEIWGYVGPALVTRVFKQLCETKSLDANKDTMCPSHNITVLKSSRFYPIPFSQWSQYFEVQPNPPSFSDSYGLHIWNYMNQEKEDQKKKTIAAGDNSVLEHIFKKYCPLTHAQLLPKAPSQL